MILGTVIKISLNTEMYEILSIPTTKKIATNRKNPIEQALCTLEHDKLEKVNVGELLRESIDQFLNLVNQYENIFDWECNSIGFMTVMSHQIITENIPPIRS